MSYFILKCLHWLNKKEVKMTKPHFETPRDLIEYMKEMFLKANDVDEFASDFYQFAFQDIDNILGDVITVDDDIEYPVYSSFIGNVLHNAPAPIAASLEIARRAIFKYIKGQFYPELIKAESLFNLWKESASWVYNSWKELFDIIKTSKVKYRRSLESFDSEVFRLKSSKSFVNLYKIYGGLEC